MLYLLLLVLPTALLMWAQWRVTSTYNRYAQVPSSMGMTGAEVATAILQEMGIDRVAVEPVGGQLTDHYDPTAKAVRLSESVYDSTSLAAAAVAAHECGHVLQDVHGYKPMNVRAALAPVANIGSNIGPWLVVLGAGMTAVGGVSNIFVNIGIVLFLAAVIFHVVTLPVEFDASRRALKLINELGILQGEENTAARKVLNAAAFTYVATALYAAIQLVQLLLSRRSYNS
jgi:uncharacterized protein